MPNLFVFVIQCLCVFLVLNKIFQKIIRMKRPKAWNDKLVQTETFSEVLPGIHCITANNKNMYIYKLQQGGLLIVNPMMITKDSLDKMLLLGEPRICMVPTYTYNRSSIDAFLPWREKFPKCLVCFPRESYRDVKREGVIRPLVDDSIELLLRYDGVDIIHPPFGGHEMHVLLTVRDDAEETDKCRKVLVTGECFNISSSGTGATVSLNPKVGILSRIVFKPQALTDHLKTIFDAKVPEHIVAILPSAGGARILKLCAAPPAVDKDYKNRMNVLFSQWHPPTNHSLNTPRHISSVAEHVLDAPDHNILDWGPNNLVAIALHDAVYLWNATNGTTWTLYQGDPENPVLVSSVKWSGASQRLFLAVGFEDGKIQIWDCSKKDPQKPDRTLLGSPQRIGCLSWNGPHLASGGQDGKIRIWDTRERDALITTMDHHKEEITSLHWSPERTTLASGGNDNVVCIWDARTCGVKIKNQDLAVTRLSDSSDGHLKPLHELVGHTSAVKGMSWSEWQAGLLVTGGGTADRTIKVWNTNTGQMVASHDLGKQITGLHWSKADRELVAVTGFPAPAMAVLTYPTFTQIGDMKGHKQRIVSSTISPDGRFVMTGSEDQTIRIWSVFKPKTTPDRTHPGRDGDGEAKRRDMFSGLEENQCSKAFISFR
ncbi:putative Cell division cycle 20.5, cofactor of APC complex [Blattamonas nauphoetae]|uniref:Cell division cycle 20.5, cofactor of APC complex n=1 Tax=Blattamonas nauphoetae TaxID=2049346 RepID=A0ABQ9YN25_9EUKA|nr:putative Cell division cycle 20.5, cofactor of APC complex [Blattamonas nauphoetae]